MYSIAPIELSTYEATNVITVPEAMAADGYREQNNTIGVWGRSLIINTVPIGSVRTVRSQAI